MDPSELSLTDLTVLIALVQHSGQILNRMAIRRLAGLQHCTIRRCDSVLVNLRRVLGPDAIITVRQRGWMLSESGVLAAQEILEHPTVT